MRIALYAIVILLAVAGLFVLGQQLRDGNTVSGDGAFRAETVDRDGPGDPWGKVFGDVDGDGHVDIVVGGHESRELVAYIGPGWSRTTIAAGERYSTDHEVADIDGDGAPDIVSLTAESMVVYYGPAFEPAVIADLKLHDVEVFDADGDGDLDLAARNQGAFGGSGKLLHLFENLGERAFRASSVAVAEGEGLAVADIDRDGDVDVVVNQFWVRNPGSADAGGWRLHRYTDSWDWLHASIATADFNADGRVDIAAAPAERAGDTYRIAWFEAPADPGATWVEHVVDPAVEAVRHSLVAADFDRDGLVDLATAAMHQGADPDAVTIYYNGAAGTRWSRRDIDSRGSHGMRTADIDGDGDPDLLGANWSGPDQTIRVWRNLTCDGAVPQWVRHVIDPDQRWTSVFVIPADLTGDGLPDVVSGAWWYRNPGDAGRHWERSRFRREPFHAGLAFDADGDGDLDVAGTAGRGTDPNGVVILAVNDGTGRFGFERLAQVDGDFLQGATVLRDESGLSLLLSWHRPDTALHRVRVAPREASAADAEVLLDGDRTANEALSVADLDGDGRADIVLGTSWLKSTTAGYELRQLAADAPPPDRNVVADVNGDGYPDVIVGSEAIDETGPITWYRNPGPGAGSWDASVIAEIVGPMSLDSGDIDGDGDIDVAAGEHNLSRPDAARLWFFENADGLGTRWNAHLVHTGDEHHDGAQLADMDNDGDLDIVSIGWSHRRVLLYENRINQCKAQGTDLT